MSRRPRGTGIAIGCLLAIACLVAALAGGTTATAVVRAHSCGDLIFTPRTDDALYDIRTKNISCRRAKHKLRVWHANDYRPRTGPRGYRCKNLEPSTRATCRRKGHRLPLISFLSGG